MKTALREIRASSDPDSAYFLRVEWRGRGLSSGLQLMLTDGRDAWRGEVSEAALREEASELEMEEEVYEEDLQQALTGMGGSASYSFDLTPSLTARCDTVTLTYEKVQGDISFRLGSVMLGIVDDPATAVRGMLLHILEKGSDLEKHNRNLEEENRRLKLEHERIRGELKRYVGSKEALETELYSRFVLVLNEKKAKIRSLQDAMRGPQEVRSSEGRKEPEGGEDEYGGSTDEEPEGTPATAASPCRGASSPSPLDDVGLSDLTDVAPCRKRRLRHLGDSDVASKRNPPQKTRSNPCPAAAAKQQPPMPTPARNVDAAAHSADEDLFEGM